MVYLSKEILFIILVVVLFVGGSSKLDYDDVEGYANNAADIQCKPGCTRATVPSGNCKWLPENVPRIQQRYICPHTCDKNKTGAKCNYDNECSKCSPQIDFTSRTYSDTRVIKGTGAACAKSKPCAFNPSAQVLNVCNPDDFPNNGANNLICMTKNATEDASQAKWVGIDTAIELLPPYTPLQTALLTCDINAACSTEGEKCTDSTGKNVICNNNLWLADPKYSSESTSGNGSSGSSSGSGSSSSGSSGSGSSGGNSSSSGGSSGSGSSGGNNSGGSSGGNSSSSGGSSGSSGSSGSGSSGGNNSGGSSGSGSSGYIVDNYYTVNHFYGATAKSKIKRTRSAATPAATPAAIPAATSAAATTTTASRVTTPSNNYGVSAGNTAVPLLVPKGEVAVVQPYESNIRF